MDPSQPNGPKNAPISPSTPGMPASTGKPAHPQRRGAARAPRNPGPSPSDVLHTRELFWNNVIREILSTLATASAMGESHEGVLEADQTPHPSDVLDGRLAVITQQGARIPIASVTPLFACGVPGNDQERVLSMDVECTVFQIETPTGEVFTLPLHEIRSFHALTDELMERLREAARAQAEEDEQPQAQEPFGFAAFTSLARSRKDANPVEFEPRFTGPDFDPPQSAGRPL